MSGGGGGGEVQESGPKKNSFGEEAVGGVDLNLTALMDILSNLLFFLLASFGATIVMAINGSVPVQSADKSDVADTGQTVTVNIKLSKAGLDLSALGTAQADADLAALRKVIPALGDKQNYSALVEHLTLVKSKYPKSDTIILTPESGVSYEMMIKTMDAARETEVKAGGQMHVVKLFPTVVVSTVVK